MDLCVHFSILQICNDISTLIKTLSCNNKETLICIKQILSLSSNEN